MFDLLVTMTIDSPMFSSDSSVSSSSSLSISFISSFSISFPPSLYLKDFTSFKPSLDLRLRILFFDFLTKDFSSLYVPILPIVVLSSFMLLDDDLLHLSRTASRFVFIILFFSFSTSVKFVLRQNMGSLDEIGWFEAVKLERELEVDSKLLRRSGEFDVVVNDTDGG